MSSRIRQVEHIEGNFSTHVAVELSIENASMLSRSIEVAEASLQAMTDEQVTMTSAFHLSLSRHVFLRPHMIAAFLRTITDEFRDQRQTTVYLKPELRMYLNDNQNTSFVSVPVDLDISPNCLQLIRRVDDVFQRFDLPCYYDNPSPHVTLGCAVIRTSGNKNFDCIEPLCSLDGIFSEDELVDLRVDVSRVSVFIGKNIHRIHLDS